MNQRTILIGTNSISLNYSTSSLTLLAFFKSKEMKESLVEVKQKQSTIDEGCIYKGITIKPSKKSKPQKRILEKPIIEMTKNIQCQIYKGSRTKGSSVGNILNNIFLSCGRG